jgi:hypothetical protein
MVLHDYLATAAFVEEADNYFHTFNGGTRIEPWKISRCPLNDNIFY